ncbi:MAG: sigma-70 family RNA polymerase sigma factor [Acidobacteria bacterium]|nr:sigma-70 family RNA polymerase sigma factor [Acidobacteriota bacterium]
MQPADESALIARAREGSRAAFEELVHLYDRSVLRLALRIVGSEEAAHDIYQEAFLRIFRSIHDFRQECAFRTWVFRVVTNLCLDHLRRAGKRQEEGPVGPRGESEARPLEALVADERPDGDPERVLARTEIRRRVEAALAGLPPRERLVFELRHEEGLRAGAIAEVLETSEETVRNCLYRAHRHLRSALGDMRTGARRAAAERWSEA